MTKEVFVESVFLRVNGGRPSSDSSVKRVDIEAYLPAVINYALTKGYYLQIQTEGDRDLPGQFSMPFYGLPIIKDNKYNGKAYVTIPKTLIPLPSNRAIRLVTGNCDSVYTALTPVQLQGLSYWLRVYSHKKFYRPIGRDLHIHNAGPLQTNINIEIIVGVEDLEDDAELPIPAGNEAEAINMCVDFITGERQMPADKKSDGRDIN